MKPVTNVYDMNSYMKELKSSFAQKRVLYSEYQSEVSVKGYDYSKINYVREKFPKFPLYLRKQIAAII